MVTRPELLALEFYKTRPFKGSDNGLRYMIQKEEIETNTKDGEGQDISGTQEQKNTKTVLMTYIWPEPFCFEATSDDKKVCRYFDFSEEGLCDAIAWINENHDTYAYKRN